MYGNGWENYDQIPPAPPARTAATYQADGLKDGFIVPVLQSLFLGFCMGVIAGLLAWQLKIPINPWITFLLVWFTEMTVSFASYRGRWQFVLERITGADLNHDGYIGQPLPALQPPPAQPVRIELIQDNARKGDYLDLPCGPEKLQALASGLTQGRQFAQSVWCGNNQLFTRAEFEATRTALIEGGLLRWNKVGFPAQGVSITPAGRAVFRRLSGKSSPTSEE